MDSAALLTEISGPGLLGGLTPQIFLKQYWQKRPLLIRQALPGFQSPISGDELAGLACEAVVESRLVLEQDGPTPWHLEHGPFEESRFAELPASHWSLLVQGCEKYSPELAELLAQFSFVPHWRVDDIMASYAPLHGSVGPHLDQYDVFLIQAQGTRRWQIHTHPGLENNFIPGIALRILRQFEAEYEWVVEPGDILYLPPGVAHFGVALEDCITLSVGFRAPSHADIISGYADDAITRIDSKARFSDPRLTLQSHPGEISRMALQQVRSIIRDAVADDHAIDDWFGRFVTEPKVNHFSQDENRLLIPQLTTRTFAEMLAHSGELQQHPECRFACIAHPDHATLYINGEAFNAASQHAPALALLADLRRIAAAQLAEPMTDPAFAQLLTGLHNHGYVVLTDPDYTLESVDWEEARDDLEEIRSRVFIEEQRVPPELEWDEHDAAALHLLALDRDRQPIGTVRLLADGHIGRLAVLPPWRGHGVGRALMLSIIAIAAHQGRDSVCLHAQTQALEFYRRLGFVAQGEVFMEAGIEHQYMTLDLASCHPDT